jgi:hypothetical protein
MRQKEHLCISLHALTGHLCISLHALTGHLCISLHALMGHLFLPIEADGTLDARESLPETRLTARNDCRLLSMPTTAPRYF